MTARPTGRVRRAAPPAKPLPPAVMAEEASEPDGAPAPLPA